MKSGMRAVPVELVRAATPSDYPAVISLLESSGLPTAGVSSSLEAFLVADDPGLGVIGTIGLEVYGNLALLRSAAVDHRRRGTGLGHLLVEHVLLLARRSGVRSVYLLTTTAEHFFPRFGFRRITRDEVPSAVQVSEEFQGACPVSAAVMHAGLEPTP